MRQFGCAVARCALRFCKRRLLEALAIIPRRCGTVAIILFALGSLARPESVTAHPIPERWEPENVLAWAVCECNGRRVNRLIAAGAAIDATDSRGMTALMWAAGSHSLIMTRTLVEAGADVHGEDYSGHNALELAVSLGPAVSHPCGSPRWWRFRCSRDAISVIGYLAPYFPPETLPISRAANRYGRWDVVPLFLRLGADPQPGGASLISTAVDENYNNKPLLTDLLKAFQAAGADFDLLGPVWGGPMRFGGGLTEFSPLFIAASRQEPEIVQLLLDLGADPGSSDVEISADAIGYAFSIGAAEIANMLLAAGGASGLLPLERWFEAEDKSVQVRLRINGEADIEMAGHAAPQFSYELTTKNGSHIISIRSGNQVSTYLYRWKDVDTVEFWRDDSTGATRTVTLRSLSSAGGMNQ